MFDKPLEQIREAYKTWFSSKPGRVALDDLCAFANIEGSSFSENSLEMAKLEGRKETVLYIFQCLDASLKKELEDHVGVEGELE